MSLPMRPISAEWCGRVSAAELTLKFAREAAREARSSASDLPAIRTADAAVVVAEQSFIRVLSAARRS